MTDTSSSVDQAETARASRRFVIPLLAISGAQLLVILNDIITTVALPTIQTKLEISTATLPWVVNAYILMFGALLLAGGRLGDLCGRRRMLQIGIVIFTLGGLIGGFAPNAATIIAARAIQGVGAALMAPNALASITTTFTAGKHRNTALGLYGAMSGIGIAVGFLLGGFLTGTLGWNSVFFINVPIAVLVLLGTFTLKQGSTDRGRLDALGAILGTGSMAALVYAITRGGEHGWANIGTLAFFGIAAVLLILFLVSQARGRSPMMPLPILKDRNRGGAYLGMFLLSFGTMSMFYLLNLYLQYVLDLTPFRTGLAWLPFAVGVVLGASIGAKLIAAFAPRRIIAAGSLLTAAAIFSLTFIGTGTSYWFHLMPAIFLSAFGFALNFIPLTSAAVESVEPERAGIASALLNTGQQIGTAIGMAVVSTVAVAISTNRMPDALEQLGSGDPAFVEEAKGALIDGYAGGMLVGTVVLVVAAVVAASMINKRRPEPALTAAE